MNLWGLVKKSLLFYWRTNLGAALAVLVCTAVLTGALVVGDSVRYSLMRMVDARLGRAELALVMQNRFFRAALADDLAEELDVPVAPVLRARGLVANSDGTRLANNVQVLGVDERFFAIGARGGARSFWSDWEQDVVLNRPLAERLGVSAGEEVKLRIEKPGMMPREVPLTPDSDLSVFSRAVVRAVASDEQFGRFGLQANQVAALNVFVPIRWLQQQLERPGRANILLLGSGSHKGITVEAANAAVKKRWRLADASLELRTLAEQRCLELRSSRVFIDDQLAGAALQAEANAVGILTYFVNELRAGDRATPYSMVAAVSGGRSGWPIRDLRDDEILINQWLADDLGAGPGDSVELTYFVLGPMRKLEQRSSSFRVSGVLPMEGPWADPELMPDFPGLADVNNCRDWKPGIPIDLARIRDKDEQYWDKYRGTPKALIGLEAGRAMWANRYGNTTAVRYPLGVSAQGIETHLLAAVEPASVGLFFQPVRQRGAKAGAEASYFGWLFLGLSFFLIASAVVLTALLFVFGAESRSDQVGMLLAVGYLPRTVRRLLLGEGVVIALAGAIGGTAAALVYTKVMMVVLSRVVPGSTMYFHVRPLTLAVGAFSAVVICAAAIWLTLRRQVSMPARELLAGVARWQFLSAGRASRPWIALAIAAAAALAAVLLPVAVGPKEAEAVAGVFFGSGSLLLIAGLSLSCGLLRIVAGLWKAPMMSIGGLGLKNCTRRSGRSLAVIALLACGVFLVVAVEAFRQDPLAHADERDSGTGGFTLFAESSIGILHDINSPAGRAAMALDEDILEGSEIVQLRVRDGDDASCFNLNRAQTPRLLGVHSVRFLNRGSFSFVGVTGQAEGPVAWDLLNDFIAEDVVPAIGDYATVKWALGKSLGDEIDYLDDQGRGFKVRIVAVLKNSILQGSLVIAEEQFVRRFESEEGYRMFLIDTPRERIDEVADHLSARLADFGLAVTGARERLAAFNEVEGAYISIFEILGGLGLVLGSIGLGLVVLRNMLERRGELAMLRAVGFNKGSLKRMVLYEHSGLMLAGLVCGLVSALVAAGPALKSPGTALPYLSLSLVVGAIAVSGCVWIWLATVLSLSSNMLDALRNE